MKLIKKFVRHSGGALADSRPASPLKPAFTLIELLVVIVIIGVLATLATIALNSTRMKARDAKRISDIKQMSTALELYFSEVGRYPTQGEFAPGGILKTPDGSKTYMGRIPNNPSPRNEGVCATNDDYVYTPYGASPTTYTIDYCLAAGTGSAPAGVAQATPTGINNVAVAAPTCTPDCTGKYCGTPDNCTGTCTAVHANADTCDAGVEKCGGAAACTDTSDTCTAGVCKCGSNPACTGGQSCVAGSCVLADCPSDTCGDCSAVACGSNCVVGTNTYGTIQVGTQCWMTKNLNVGTVLDPAGATNAMKDKNPATDGVFRYCHQGNSATTGTDTTNCTADGGLYTWAMAMYLPAVYNGTDGTTVFTSYTGSGATAKRRGICPVGWHIPSDYEWSVLERATGDTNIPDPNGANNPAVCSNTNHSWYADNTCSDTTLSYSWRGTASTADWTNGVGAKLLCTSQYNQGWLNTPSYCIAASYPAIYPKFNLAGIWGGSSFYDRSSSARLWSSSQTSAGDAWRRNLSASSSQSRRNAYSKTFGNSVRCLKD